MDRLKSHWATLVTIVIGCVWMTSPVDAQTGLPSLEEALEISKKSGVPILAMAGRKT